MTRPNRVEYVWLRLVVSDRSRSLFADTACALRRYQGLLMWMCSCHPEVAPTPATRFTEQFADAAFGTDRFIALTPGRGTALVCIEAVGPSAEEAARRANGAVATLRSALSRQQPATVTVIDAAEPALAPFYPNKRLHMVVGLGFGAAFGLAGVTVLGVAFARRRIPGR